MGGKCISMKERRWRRKKNRQQHDHCKTGCRIREKKFHSIPFCFLCANKSMLMLALIHSFCLCVCVQLQFNADRQHQANLTMYQKVSFIVLPIFLKYFELLFLFLHLTTSSIRYSGISRVEGIILKYLLNKLAFLDKIQLLRFWYTSLPLSEMVEVCLTPSKDSPTSWVGKQCCEYVNKGFNESLSDCSFLFV